MSRKKVAPYAEEGKPDYYHLNPVVEFLLKSGNKSCNDFIWGNNRTGYFCHLEYEIDFVLLLEKFDFPDSIKINEYSQSIDCFNTYTLIKGNMC